MKPHVATAIRILAQFFFSPSIEEPPPPLTVTTLRVPLLVSLHALESPIKSVEIAGEPESFAKITAHLQVRYGTFALKSFYFWLHYQILHSVLKHGIDPDTKSFDDLLQMFLGATEDAGLSSSLKEYTDEIVTILSPTLPENPDDWTRAMDILGKHIEPIASRHFGIIHGIQRGSVENLGLSYGEVYRLAMHSGVLRGRLTFDPLFEATPHEKDRNRYEFYQILDRLGVIASIPPDETLIHQALNSVIEPDNEVPPRLLFDLFLWSETYLDVVFGGQAVIFHRISYFVECICLFLVEPEPLINIIQEHVDDLIKLTESFPNFPADSVCKSIERAILNPFDASICWEESTSITVMVQEWLRRVVPTDEGEEMLQRKKRIFLSHKSVNKPLVKRVRDALILLGFEPWLDEDEMRAGDVPLRAIQRGLEQSCAAVFFITPEFQDNRWLAREIDSAVRREIDDPERFRVITLVFRQEGKPDPVVPETLKDYIYKEAASELEALMHIVRALPIKLGTTEWRYEDFL